MRGEKGKIGAVGLEEEEEEVGVCEGRLWTLIFGPLVMTGNYVSNEYCTCGYSRGAKE